MINSNMKNSKETIIITAGGIGKRMNSTIPKQFLELNGTPILMHSIQRFHDYNSDIQILITLPSDWIPFWKELCQKHDFNIEHQLVDGGIERYDSIKNALSLSNGEVIGVHDGVRPLVSTETISRCFSGVKDKKACIPFLPMKESIRKIEKNQSSALIRSEYVTVQTPQCFERELLINAYKQPFHEGITDDASLVEEFGEEIQLIEGNEENIKITSKTDLLIAESLVQSII